MNSGTEWPQEGARGAKTEALLRFAFCFFVVSLTAWAPPTFGQNPPPPPPHIHDHFVLDGAGTRITMPTRLGSGESALMNVLSTGGIKSSASPVSAISGALPASALNPAQIQQALAPCIGNDGRIMGATIIRALGTDGKKGKKEKKDRILPGKFFVLRITEPADDSEVAKTETHPPDSAKTFHHEMGGPSDVPAQKFRPDEPSDAVERAAQQDTRAARAPRNQNEDANENKGGRHEAKPKPDGKSNHKEHEGSQRGENTGRHDAKSKPDANGSVTGEIVSSLRRSQTAATGDDAQNNKGARNEPNDSPGAGSAGSGAMAGIERRHRGDGLPDAAAPPGGAHAPNTGAPSQNSSRAGVNPAPTLGRRHAAPMGGSFAEGMVVGKGGKMQGGAGMPTVADAVKPLGAAMKGDVIDRAMGTEKDAKKKSDQDKE